MVQLMPTLYPTPLASLKPTMTCYSGAGWGLPRFVLEWWSLNVRLFYRSVYWRRRFTGRFPSQLFYITWYSLFISSPHVSSVVTQCLTSMCVILDTDEGGYDGCQPNEIWSTSNMSCRHVVSCTNYQAVIQSESVTHVSRWEWSCVTTQLVCTCP